MAQLRPTYYGIFDYTWTPPKEGTYTILTIFVGDDSYSSSGTATTVSVGLAPTSTGTDNQQQITIPNYTMTIIARVIAV